MQNELKRSLSLIDVVSLGINGVIGTGIFLLPGIAAGMMGPASILTLLFAGLLSFLIALCFAEVGSQFRGTGGAYLYALRTFGDAPGFVVGWMVLVVTVTAWATMVNGLATATAEYIPQLAHGPWRAITIVGFMALLTGINLRGAKLGARVSVLFSVAKLVPLLLFVVVGLFHIKSANFSPFAPHGFGSHFFEATLVILYAFVGFEALVVPAGEMSNPRRAVPIALLCVLVLVCLIYMGVMAVATGTLSELAGHENPVVGASQNFMGSLGAQIIGAGVIISMIGINSAQALVGPRRVYALAEQGHMPSALAKINPQGVPYVSLIALFIVSAVIAVYGDFKTLAKVTVVARFAQYIATCLAVLVLRHRRKKAQAEVMSGMGAPFRIPGGALVPVLALLLCAWLLIESGRSNPDPFIKGGYALLAGLPVYLLIANRRRVRGR